MFVSLKFRTKDGRVKKSSMKVTVKEAIEYYKTRLKDDENIIKVWLVYFHNWHEGVYKILKLEKI